VKIVYGKELGKNLSVEQLQKEGNKVIFIGIGQPEVSGSIQSLLK
jgi:NADPH-dependent glutamate synthase beta subunit-like oxidoreductase